MLSDAGVLLLSDHAIMKVRQDLIFLDDINRHVLLEELRLSGRTNIDYTEKVLHAEKKKAILLVVDDDFRNLATPLIFLRGNESMDNEEKGYEPGAL